MAKKVTATILFIDIMDSLEIANYWDARRYDNFLNEFQDTMLSALTLYKTGIKGFNLAGDELVVFYCSQNIWDDIGNVIALANTAKILWYISRFNRG